MLKQTERVARRTVKSEGERTRGTWCSSRENVIGVDQVRYSSSLWAMRCRRCARSPELQVPRVTLHALLDVVYPYSTPPLMTPLRFTSMRYQMGRRPP